MSGSQYDKDQEARILVLENQMEQLENISMRQEEKIDKIGQDITEVKSHLSRQNGAIPHMQEDVRHLRNSIATIVEHNTEQSISKAKIIAKTKVYIAIASGISILILGALLREIIPRILETLFSL